MEQKHLDLTITKTMKTRLIWHDCKLNDDKNSFWVECTDEEVARCILPYVLEKKDELMIVIERNKGFSQINKNLNEQVFCNFFLISTDYKCIKSYDWVLPYGGMWNAGNPFKEINSVDFQSLDELQGIYDKLDNK